MTRIVGTVKVAASKTQLWDVVNDFPNICRASSQVMESHSTSDLVTGVGATRHCDLPRGAQVEERILEWTDGEYMKIEMYRTKRMPLIKNMTAEFVVRGDDEQTPTAKSVLIKFAVRWFPMLIRSTAALIVLVGAVEFVTVFVRKDNRSLRPCLPPQPP